MPIGVRYQRSGGYGRLFEWGSYLATSQFPFGNSVLGESQPGTLQVLYFMDILKGCSPCGGFGQDWVPAHLFG